MTKLLLTISTIILLLLTACENDMKPRQDVQTKKRQTDVPHQADPCQNALTFINTYVANANKIHGAQDITDWVNANELVTDQFKQALKKIIDDAYRLDPEMGLDFDPILDAQDYPDQGFEIEWYDDGAMYISLKGKNMPDFKLTMKVIKQNGTCLVDGCGMVNISQNKRAKR